MVMLGCGSPWAYLQVLRQRLLRPTAVILWVPCFHPPDHVRHTVKAHLARWALRLAQRANIEVRVLSAQEHARLDAGRCQGISLGFERRFTLSEPQPDQARPFDLVFLGRPTAQKGWPLFEHLAQRTGLPSLALLAHPPEQPPAAEITVITAGSDAAVQSGLARSKLLLLPADYESFGFAQAEALAMGCCVPVLGEWPLWLDVPELDWRGLDAAAIAARIQGLLGPSAQWRWHLRCCCQRR
ncbi:MAG: glycosyltransferase family 1 protein [Synechococcaceae bacterium WB9_2_112]|nr:glycosyltransferase family 1 protein [Synechococcaceae bacterium WB9_2_112]